MAEDAAPGDDPIAEQTTRTPLPAAKRRAPRLARGTCIGRYVVIDVIGAGGMGVVYRAYDPELDRRIALKLVRDSRSDPGRLVAEAQALARVSHPNVVHVYDVGTIGDQVFIAMELVEGKTVHAWRAQMKPPRKQLLEVFLAAGRGLAGAHKAGIVHRDFKPSNVIVGDDGRVRVADFGLARAGDVTPDPSTRTPSASSLRASGSTTSTPISPAPLPPPVLTGGETESETEPASPTVDEQESEEALDDAHALDTVTSLPRVVASRVMGTPSYMAPEQRRTGVYDARVDQYAFAVALYETLYGERPFAGATDAEIAFNALGERVRPPPKGADVPAHLRRTLLRALHAEPDDRFPSMDAMLDELTDDPIARRRRLIAGGAGLALAALAVWLLARGGGAADPCGDDRDALRGAWDPDVAARIDRALRATNRPYAPAVANRVAAALGARADEWGAVRRGACLAHARGDTSSDLNDREHACLDRRAGELRALTAELARGPDPALLDHALDAIAALPATAACADRDALLAVPPPADPALRARVAALRGQLAQADAEAWTGQYLAARDRAAALAKDAAATGYPPVVAEALYVAGRAARRAADFTHAEPLLYEAAARAAAARDDLLAAEAWVELVGVVGYDLARPVEGKPLAKAAAAAVARAGAAPALRARLLHAEALVASETSDLDTALADEREALALREEGGDDLAIAESVNDLARITSDRGDYAGAEALHRRALELRKKALGDAHPLVADSLDNLGVVLFHQGHIEEARGFYEQALALRTAALGPDARDVGTTLNNLGALYLDVGDDARATDYLERALAVWEKALGTEHPDLAIPLSNLADLANKRGDHAHAKALCARALAIDLKAKGPDAADLAYDLVCLGESELAAAPAAARDHLERALALREASPGDVGELARTRFDLAQTLVATGGDRTRARDLASKACQTFDSLRGTWTAKRDACTAWLATH